MSKNKKGQTTIFDQKNQEVGHQVNIAGGDNQENIISLGADQSKIFEEVFEFIQSSELSEAQKAEISNNVKNIEKEVTKGEDADDNILTTLLKAVVSQIPEIATVLLTTILNPAAGASSGIKMIANKILTRA